MASEETTALLSKDEANYAVGDEALCSGCANFISPASCSIVAGTISPDGSCDYFQGGTEAPLPSAETAPGIPPDIASMLFGGTPDAGY